jgi:hypothetical protein
MEAEPVVSVTAVPSTPAHGPEVAVNVTVMPVRGVPRLVVLCAVSVKELLTGLVLPFGVSERL